MQTETRHLSVHIARPVAQVYAFASDAANLPRWADGVDCAAVTLTPPNPYGVLDHEVALPDGGSVYVPLRAIADGDGCEVVFTLRRAPGMTDAEFARDVATVTGDLGRLKSLVERGDT